MTTPRTALVIGAGIAGPVAAMALRKAGIQPTVYEAHPTRAEGTGTFLTIASNGIDALRVIGRRRAGAGRRLSHPDDHAAQHHRQEPGRGPHRPDPARRDHQPHPQTR